ncbi:MAG: hypothetical protein KKF65_03245, partial [Nanoarchaeota archaeon]|nr:hypothetical protein [Nanoarchaeota archaeon]
MKDRKTGWRFEKSESGGVEGLNHGGVESFKNNHLLSLAKESAQNSLDAQNDKNKPVILEFKKFLIDPSDFPDVENFKKILKLQINFWQKAKNDKSTEEFFKEAITTINSKISCLRVSDFNTTGLEGSKEGKNNWLSRWFKLVRSEGSTDNNPLAGGSFGLGKFANFACSKVRTVFYSTKDLQGTEAHQGVSILASYDTNEEERKRAKGYYCTQEDFSAISGPIYLDKNFKRETPGTDIYIVGFIENEENLEDQLFISILNSFLLAIYKGNLIFKLNDKIVNKDVLSSIINN